VMILFIRVGKSLLDLAINLVPVPSNPGVEPARERTQLVRKVFALVVRTQVTIAHQHLAGFWQRVPLLSRVIVILEMRAGLQIAGIGAPARLLGQYLIQIGSHS